MPCIVESSWSGCSSVSFGERLSSSLMIGLYFMVVVPRPRLVTTLLASDHLREPRVVADDLGLRELGEGGWLGTAQARRHRREHVTRLGADGLARVGQQHPAPAGAAGVHDERFLPGRLVEALAELALASLGGHRRISRRVATSRSMSCCRWISVTQ